MNKQKRLKELQVELQRLEQGFKFHHEIPGHPDFCTEGSVTIYAWDCMLGSAESAGNLRIDATSSLKADPKKLLAVLKRAVKWQEYDIKMRQAIVLKAEIESSETVAGK